MSETKVNSSLFSKFKKTQVNSIQKLPDITGLTIDGFHVDSRLDIVSGEADIYLCSRVKDNSGKSFLLKYYRRENAVKPDVIEKLKTVNNPCVAPIEGFGEYEGHQYVVRPYYEMSALSELLAEGTRFSEEDLKNLIIPSIIEGLKAVHDAGILHKDLKPANMIPDDNGEHIVLIDFGISSDAGKNTFVVTQTGMTPFYAAPEAMQGIFHRETDYYALGITIFELFTGFMPFQNPGITGEEAARLASISKIEFPDNFPENLKNLVLGLTYKDISHRNEKENPNRRWGYDEVKRWFRGEDVPIPGDALAAGNTTSVAVPAFYPYRFCGKNYTSETELLRTMLRQPEDALKDLGRGFLSHHYYAFSEKKGELCSAAETKLGNNASENLRQMAALIYRLSPTIRDIPYNGGILENIHDLGRAFIDAGIREAVENGSLRGKNTKLTQSVRDFVLSGIPEDYASIVLKNTGISRLFENTRRLWNQEQRPDSDTELTLILGYSLCDERRIPVHGKVYDSPEAFCREMKELSKKDRKAYTEFTGAAKADLDFLKKRLPDEESRKFISKSRKDSKSAVFGDNEYHFRNGEDFGINAKKGEFIKFGSYPMEANGQKGPIEWLVLEDKGDEALLISRYGLDWNYYSLCYGPWWEGCTLRRWLNNDFLKAAFSEDEIERIKVSKLRNKGNSMYHTCGGNLTEDRVFCLSIDEAKRYFKNDESRKCQATDYALSCHSSVKVDDERGYCYWWLRSPGCRLDYGTAVYCDGKIDLEGEYGIYFGAVRPALRIILN